MQGETVAITGVGGFIGLRLTERLRERGARVVGLDHAPEAARLARERGAEVVVGGVNDDEALRRLCAGASWVIHAAAVVAEQGARDLFWRVNVEGTRQVARAARDAGARRLLQVSSVMVYGFRFPDQVGEDGPLRGEGNPYCETKIESERVALSFDDPGGMRVVVARPGDVYGPRSVPWVLRPLTLMKQGLFVVPDRGKGRINTVHVDNLIDGFFLCLERGEGGRAYNLTDGVSEEVGAYFLRLARLLGWSRVRSMPASVLRGAFGVVARGAALLGREPPAYPDAVDYLLRPGTYSIAAARGLGYAPRVRLDEGMEEVRQWLEAEGLLDR